jgi:hypothetical protein
VSLLLRVPGRQLLILGRRVTPHRTSRRSSGVDVSGTCVSPLSSTVMPRSTCGSHWHGRYTVALDASSCCCCSAIATTRS